MSIDSLEVSDRGAEARRERKAKVAPRRQQPQPLPSGILTAGMLIALLEDYDPEAPIVIEGQYGGFECVRRTSRLPLRLNVNSLEGFGPHDRVDFDEAADVTAVAILTQPGSVVYEE